MISLKPLLLRNFALWHGKRPSCSRLVCSILDLWSHGGLCSRYGTGQTLVIYGGTLLV